MPGEWTYKQELTLYESFLFYHSIGDDPDYDYRPVAIAYQTDDGTSYRFLCIAEPKQIDKNPFFTLIEIYQPVDGYPSTTNFRPIL